MTDASTSPAADPLDTVDVIDDSPKEACGVFGVYAPGATLRQWCAWPSPTHLPSLSSGATTQTKI